MLRTSRPSGLLERRAPKYRNSRPAYLLRESVREGKRVTKRTLANLSSLPIEQIEAIRLVLKDETLGPVGGGFECVASRQHGPLMRCARRWRGSASIV